MKRGILILIIIIIFSLNMIAAASYECSLESDLNKDRGEIDINGRKSINGLGIGLYGSDETPAIRSYSADLLIDAYTFLLNDETKSEEIDFKSGKKTITLNNISLSIVEIDVDGKKEKIELKELVNVNGYYTYISYVEDSFPGAGSAKGIIGKEKISLSNDNPSSIIKINNTDYLIEIFSASDTNAIIEVSKCDNKDASITQVVEIIEPETLDNVTANDFEEANDSKETINSEELNEINAVLNDSEEKSKADKNNETQEPIEEIKKESKIEINYSLIISIISILIGLIALFLTVRFLRNKLDENHIWVTN